MYSLEFMKVITREEVQTSELKMHSAHKENKIGNDLNIIKHFCKVLIKKIPIFKKITYEN